MKYILSYDHLHLGDIILTAEKTPTSKGIRFGTSSDFSHAMIYVGHSVIHATTEGIFSKNLQRHLARKPTHIKVLRLKSSLTPEQAKSICVYARDKVGSVYSKVEAYRTVTKARSGPAKSRRQFCSRLVAQAYASVGILLVSNPDYCTPEEINCSPQLDEITGVVRKATSEEIAFGKKKDPVLFNQRETYKWLNKVRKLAAENNFEIQTQNDVLGFLLKNPSFDKKVVDLIRKTKYLTGYDFDREANPYRFDVDQFMAELAKNICEANEILIFELNKEVSLVSRYSEMLSFYKGLANTELKYVSTHIDLYSDLLKISEERLFILEKVTSISNCPELFRASTEQLSLIKRALDA